MFEVLYSSFIFLKNKLKKIGPFSFFAMNQWKSLWESSLPITFVVLKIFVGFLLLTLDYSH